MQEPKIAQLHALLQAGLVPWSMAGDLGEAERRAACETSFLWFTLDEPSLDKWPYADSNCCGAKFITSFDVLISRAHTRALPGERAQRSANSLEPSGNL